MTLDDLERFRDEWRHELNKHDQCSTQENELICGEGGCQRLTSAGPRQGNSNVKCDCNIIRERLPENKSLKEQYKVLSDRKRTSDLIEMGFESEKSRFLERDSSSESCTSSSVVRNLTSRTSRTDITLAKCKKTKLTSKEPQPREDEDTKNLFSPVHGLVKENLLEILIADIDETVSLPFFDLELPKEIAIKIFKYLEIKDLGNCACVNTKWKILAEDDMIWYYMCQRNGYVRDGICALDRDGWKQHFKENFISSRTFTQNWKQRICQISELEYEKGGILYAASAFKDKVIAGYANGLIKLWDIFKEAPAASFGSLVSESETECDYDNSISCVATNDNICVAGYNNGDVKLWLNRLDFPLLHTYNAGSKIQCLSLNKKSSSVISTFERKFRVDSTDENGQWYNVFQRILDKKITSAQFYDDNSHKAVISTKDAVEIHCKDGQVDEIERTASAEISCVECQDNFITVALTPLDFSILDGYRVKLFTSNNGHLKHIMKGPHCLISCLCSYDNQLTAVGCSDKKIRVHDHRLENAVMSLRGLSSSPCSLKKMEEEVERSYDMRKMVSAQNKKKKKSGGFQSMGLSYPVFKGIIRKGYKIPTPIQRKTIPLLLDGKDVVAMARTGSGKTAAFLIPMFEKLHTHDAKGPRALILSPTRELAMQTLKFTKELGKFTGLKSTCILGGDKFEDQFAALHQNPDIIIATPGRFLHLAVEMNLKLQTIEYVVFDEADRLFEMGFAEQLQEVIRRLPEARQTLLFSATLPKLLIEFSKAGLNDPALIRLDVDTKISDQLRTSFFSVRAEDKEALLLHILQNVIKQGEQTVVFVATKHHVEYIKSVLVEAGIDCSYIYSALDQTARKINVAKFQKKITLLLVVTDVAARGIDIPMLDNVINFDFPAKPKLFVHRVGRVARAGRSGTAYSFVSTEELPYMLDLHLFLGNPVKFARDTHKKDDDGLYGAVPRACLDDEEEYLVRIHEKSHDLVSSKQVMENACKQYIRSRPAPSSESVKRSKEMVHTDVAVHPLLAERLSEVESGRNKLLDNLKNFKPGLTIFEARGAKKATESSLIMKTKRDYHEAVIVKNKVRVAELKQSSDIRQAKLESEAQDATVTVRDPSTRKRKQGYRDENYIPSRSSDLHTEKGLTVRSFEQDASGVSLDFVADDTDAMRKQKNVKHWDRKRKKFVGPSNDKGAKKVKTESGAWIKASYKTNKYKEWMERNRGSSMNKEVDNEDEHSGGKGRAGGKKRDGKKIGKGMKGRKGNDLKSKDQILKQRIKKQSIESRLKSKNRFKKGGVSKGKRR